MESLNTNAQASPMIPIGEHQKKVGSLTLRLELKGRFSDKVQIAATFQEAYQLLDRLCESSVRELAVVYAPDFQVEPSLINDFERAAREALAYKDALSFGRDIPTQVEGREKIHCPRTRAMVAKIHEQN